MQVRAFNRAIAILGAIAATCGSAASSWAATHVTATEGRVSVALDGESVATIHAPNIADVAPTVALGEMQDDWQRIEVRWPIKTPTRLDDVAVAIDLQMRPDFHWMPHLAHEDGFVAAQHSFRSPAIIVAEGRKTFIVVPDLALVGKTASNPWYLDLDAPQNRCTIGLSLTETPLHVAFRKAPGMVLQPPGAVLAFYVTAYHDAEEVPNPFNRVSGFLWSRFAASRFAAGEPLRVPLDRYVQHAYHWAFQGWSKFVWQEFDLQGVRVGAPQFIVNVTQSPNFPGPWSQRESLSIWNQAWFSSLRSAAGLRRWAERTGNDELLRKANLTKALALAAPTERGVYKSVIAVPNREHLIDGQRVLRPETWDAATWINSNRAPYNFGINEHWFHVLDASFTGLLMLRWHEELEADPRLLKKATAYADELLELQQDDGFFPGWLHPETLQPGPVMNRTPETSMSVTFLLKLAQVTGQEKYKQAALRAMDAVVKSNLPIGQWEDFETYWSCSGFGQDFAVGKKFPRNNMFKQNTLSIFWTAEALLASYQATADRKYLAWGRRALDELSMHQQVWQPPFIYVPALGGFGVMNFDGEWNDARQSLFAELFLDYYRTTGDEQLFQRGVAALKASFIMMYCPENPHVRDQYEKAHPFFGKEDFGFTMENYAHDAHPSAEGAGIGPFTIYDWGNGAACEARNRIRDHYGDVYIDVKRGRAFGLDSLKIERLQGAWHITDLADSPRSVRVVFSSGQKLDVSVDGSATVKDKN
jgi:hypothetical protein